MRLARPHIYIFSQGPSLSSCVFLKDSFHGLSNFMIMHGPIVLSIQMHQPLVSMHFTKKHMIHNIDISQLFNDCKAKQFYQLSFSVYSIPSFESVTKPCGFICCKHQSVFHNSDCFQNSMHTTSRHKRFLCFPFFAKASNLR